LKRLLVHAAGFNLSLILRKTLGVGKPRRLQGLCPRLVALLGAFYALLAALIADRGNSDSGSPQERHFVLPSEPNRPPFQRPSVFAAA
jgi:hypothetical protein